MPIACNKDARLEIWLESDAAKPAAERPTFLFRYQTVRKLEQLVAQDGLVDDAGWVEAMKALIGTLAAELLGWRNMRNTAGEPLAFEPRRSAELLGEIVTLPELRELAVKLVHSQEPDEAEVGESSGPSPSSTEESAPDAAAPSEAQDTQGPDA